MEYDQFVKELDWYNNELITEEEIEHPYGKADMVNSPAHYTAGKTEVIDVIEDAVSHANNPTVGMLQGQVLKYVLRMWLKGKPRQDAQKAKWYLERLIEKLNEQ